MPIFRGQEFITTITDRKDSVRVASTVNINLAATSVTSIDGISLSDKDRVLLAGQTTAQQNGIYTWSSTTQRFTRSRDADSSVEVTPGLKVYVEEGLVNSSSDFVLANIGTITLGVTPLVFKKTGAVITLSTDGQFGASNRNAIITVNKQGQVIAVSDTPTYITNENLEFNSITINGAEIPLGADAIFDSDDIPQGSTNLYYTDERVRAAISVSGDLNYNSATGVISYTGSTGSYNDLTDKPDLTVYATTEYVNSAVSNLVDSAPELLNTLNEISAALGDDANFAATISNQLSLKANTADLATVATSGSYTDLTNKPDLSVYQLSANAFSGSYTDLTNKPDLSVYQLSANAFSGSYNDLTNKPTLFSGSYTDLTNKPDLSVYQLSANAFSGDYNDLINTPVIPDITGKLDLSGGTMTGTLILSSDPVTELEAATKQYVDSATASVNINSIGDISDVTLTSLQTGQILKYNGVEWINEAFTTGDVLPSQDGNAGKLLTTDGTTVSWIVPALVAGTASHTTELFTATAGQTTFAVDYTVGYIDVYLNGVKLIDGYDYTATNGSSIVLADPTTENDVIEVDVWQNIPNAAYTRYSYTATEAQTSFAAEYLVGTVDVYLNGIKLSDSADYIATNGTTIELTSAANQDDILEIVAWQNITATSGVNLLPSQSGNSGYILSTDGTTASWIPAPTGFSGSYADLTNTPDLSVYQLSANAFSGDYNDLSNTPTIPSLAGYATETYVNTAVSNLVDTAPELLNTLNELAAALGDDPDFATTITAQIALKANSADLATVATSGSYTDLTNKPDLSVYQLSANAFSGSYTDLTNKPTLFSGSYTDLTNKPDLSVYQLSAGLATVATTGSYNDLLNTPTLFSGSYTDLTNKPDLSVYQLSANAFSGDYNDLINTPTLATVATSGSYTDLTNKPTLFSGSYTDLTNKPTLFSGSYTDLTNKPDLSVYQLSANLATVATSGSYNDLTDKPTIPSLTGYATETYVNTAVSDLVAAAPTTLDTLNELAAALGDDPNFATSIANQIGLKANTADLATVATSGDYNDLSNTPVIPDITGKLDLSGGTMTGTLVLSSDPATDLEAATKQYVDSATASVNINSIGDISDVTLTSLQTGQILKYNGIEWVNETFTSGDVLPSQTGNEGKLLTTDGTTASWTAPALVAGTASYTKEVFTATADQTTFTVDYTVGYIDVYLNGLKLIDSDDYAATNGSSIILASGLSENDILEVDVWQNIPNAAYTKYSYTATEAQTSFNAEYFVGTVDVYLNGIKLSATTDYIATNGTTIELTSAANQDDLLEIVAWQNITATSGVNLLPSQSGNSGYILSTDGTTASWIPAPTGFSGSYNDLTNTPDLSVYQLSANAFSGDYNDLINTPTLFSGSYTDLTNKPDLSIYQLSANAFSGSYADLTDKPTIPSLDGYATETYVNTALANLVDTAPETLNTLNELAAALGDDPNFATTVSNQIGLKANTSDLATVATSGSYADLTNKPTLFSGDYTDLTNNPDLSVYQLSANAFSGSYADLTNKPTLFSGNYADLTDKPTIPTVNDASITIAAGTGLSGGGVFTTNQSGPSTITLNSTITQYTDADARAAISVTDAGGDGSLSYSNGVITYTGPNATEVRAHFTAGTGITVTDGEIATTITQYTDADTDARIAASSINDLSDITITTPSSGQVLKYNGSVWVNDADSTGTTIDSIDDIADVTITSPSDGQVLKYNGTAWINDVIEAGSSVTVSETAPLNPSEGDLWYDSTSLQTYIYYLDGNSNYAWVSIDPTTSTVEGIPSGLVAGVASYTTEVFTATSGQTTFTVDYNVGYVDVYLNGVKLIDNDDYTATNGTSVVLAVAAAESDAVEVVVWNNTRSWQEKTTNYTAVAGDKLFVDCSGGAVTVTLPSTPSMGDEITIVDAEGNAAINNITISRNGEKIMGDDADFTIDVNESSITLTYYNSTRGWIITRLL